MNRPAPSLQALFLLLRNAGVPVGMEEIGRLAAVFSLEPALDGAGLRQVLESVLVKSVEQRAVFGRVYQRWLATAERELEALAAERDGAQRDSAKRAAMPAAMPARARKTATAAAATPQVAPGGAAFADSFDAGEAPAPAPQARPQAVQPAELSRAEPAAKASPGEPAPAARMPEIEQAAPMQVALAPGTRRRLGRLIGAAAVLVAVLIFVLRGDHHVGPGAGTGPTVAAHRNSAEASILAGQRAVHAPELTVEPLQRQGPGSLPYGLLAVSLLLAVGLWRAFGAGRWLPSLARPRSLPPGPPIAAATPRPRADALILDERDEEDLVWGVGRFVSDELGRELDVTRTVDETAAAFGRPVLCFQAAHYQREIWLWVDESLNTPVARHLASDLASTLERSGLPVVRATFWGVPDVLTTSEGERVAVDTLDGQRDGAAVAILTDGRLIAHAHRARDRRAELHALLRNLSFWPRVTFIDFGDGALQAIAARHGLRVIEPDEAPLAISDMAQESAEGERSAATSLLAGDARVWAAACALSPRPVSDRVALALRRKLGLRTSAWAIDLLRDSAERDAGGMTWSVAHRSALLAWFIDAEELPLRRSKLPHHSLLSRVVAAWERIIDERELEHRRKLEQRGDAWEGSLEARELEIERGFVRLWERPAQAVAALYERFRGDCAPLIRHHMAALAPREAGARGDVLVLPWRLSEQRRETQVLLAEMGFGARAGSVSGARSMPRPGRMWLALGLCLGLTAGVIAGLVAHALRELPAVLDVGDRPDKAWAHLHERQPDGTWRAEVRTPWNRDGEVQSVPAGTRVRVDWRQEVAECKEDRGGIKELRCTSEHRPPDASPERWSFAVISTEPSEPLAQAVARELLDSGTVDGVFLVGEPIPWEELAVERMARPGARGDQLLMVVRLHEGIESRLRGYEGSYVLLSIDELGDLRGVVDFARGQEAPLAALLPGAGKRVRDLRGDPGAFIVRGQGECGAEGQRCCGDDSVYTASCHDGFVCDDGVCVLAPEQPEPDPPRPPKQPEQTPSDPPRPEPQQRCTPGTTRCSEDRTTLLECGLQGRAEIRRPCGPAQVCRLSACRPIKGALISVGAASTDGPAWPHTSRVRCTAGGRVATFGVGEHFHGSKQPRGDSSAALLPVIHVAIDDDQPLQLTCRLPSDKGAVTVTHALEPASEGKHSLTIPADRGNVKITYVVRFKLDEPAADALYEPAAE